MESLRRLSQGVMTAEAISWRLFLYAVARGVLILAVKVDHLAFPIISANEGCLRYPADRQTAERLMGYNIEKGMKTTQIVCHAWCFRYVT